MLYNFFIYNHYEHKMAEVSLNELEKFINHPKYTTISYKYIN